MGEYIKWFECGPWLMSLEAIRTPRMERTLISLLGQDPGLVYYHWMNDVFDDVFDTVFQPLRDICYDKGASWT